MYYQWLTFQSIYTFPVPDESTTDDTCTKETSHDEDEDFTVESDSASEEQPSDSEGACITQVVLFDNS